MKRRRKSSKKEGEMKKKKKKKGEEEAEDNRQRRRRGKKRIVSWRLGGPFYLPLFLPDPLSPLSSFYFHEGEEPVCIRGAERKNRKSEGKGIESRLAALPLPHRAHQAMKNQEEL